MCEVCRLPDFTKEEAETSVFGSHQQDAKNQRGQGGGSGGCRVEANPQDEEKEDEEKVAEGLELFGEEEGEWTSSEGNAGDEGSDFVGEADGVCKQGDEQAPSECEQLEGFVEAATARHDAPQDDLLEGECCDDKQNALNRQKKPLRRVRAVGAEEDQQDNGDEILCNEDGDAVGAHAFMMQGGGGEQLENEDRAREDERQADEEGGAQVESPKEAEQHRDDGGGDGVDECEQEGLFEEFSQAARMQDESGEEEQQGDA